jgi:hypothetical protein
VGGQGGWGEEASPPTTTRARSPASRESGGEGANVCVRIHLNGRRRAPAALVPGCVRPPIRRRPLERASQPLADPDDQLPRARTIPLRRRRRARRRQTDPREGKTNERASPQTPHACRTQRAWGPKPPRPHNTARRGSRVVTVAGWLPPEGVGRKTQSTRKRKRAGGSPQQTNKQTNKQQTTNNNKRVVARGAGPPEAALFLTGMKCCSRSPQKCEMLASSQSNRLTIGPPFFDRKEEDHLHSHWPWIVVDRSRSKQMEGRSMAVDRSRSRSKQPSGGGGSRGRFLLAEGGGDLTAAHCSRHVERWGSSY